MATIRKLRSGKYNVQIRRKDIPRQSRSFSTLEQAQQWADSMERAASRNSLSDGHTDARGHDYAFRVLGTRYCTTVLRGRPSFDMTLVRINRIADLLPDDIRNITKFDLHRYKLQRLEQVAPVTCRDELQLVHRVYRWAYRELILSASDHPSPCTEVAMPPPSKPRNRVITKAELKLLLGELSPVMAAITELAYETAMRRGEIVKLTPRHLHLDQQILSVINGKTGDRSVPLTRRAVELLRSAAEACPHADARIYPVTAHAVSLAFRRARTRLLMDDSVRFHQLRHSRISEVAKMGLNQAQIMMVSGHRDVRSVQRYTHLNVLDVIPMLESSH